MEELVRAAAKRPKRAVGARGRAIRGAFMKGRRRV